MNNTKPKDIKAQINPFSLKEIEEIKEKECIGFGGWLSLVQTGMILLCLISYTGLFLPLPILIPIKS